MPLVVLCGIPASGKTVVAHDLKDWLANNYPSYEYVLINDESLNISKVQGYTDPAQENKSRAAFKSTVERSISKNTVVLADGLNYIKGYRYELWCIARATSTPHCVIHVLSTLGRAIEKNTNRSEGYPDELLKDLVERFEEPNNQTKWDSPLFSVDPDFVSEDFFQKIAVAICTDKIKKPPSFATTITNKSSNESVYDLDRITQRVVDEIISQMKPFGPSTVTLLGSDQLCFPMPCPLAELHKLRRQFIHLNRNRSVKNSDIQNLFLQYIAGIVQLHK